MCVNLNEQMRESESEGEGVYNVQRENMKSPEKSGERLPWQVTLDRDAFWNFRFPFSSFTTDLLLLE